jgi:hypothetical protein
VRQDITAEIPAPVIGEMNATSRNEKTMNDLYWMRSATEPETLTWRGGQQARTS